MTDSATESNDGMFALLQEVRQGLVAQDELIGRMTVHPDRVKILREKHIRDLCAVGRKASNKEGAEALRNLLRDAGDELICWHETLLGDLLRHSAIALCRIEVTTGADDWFSSLVQAVQCGRIAEEKLADRLRKVVIGRLARAQGTRQRVDASDETQDVCLNLLTWFKYKFTGDSDRAMYAAIDKTVGNSIARPAKALPVGDCESCAGIGDTPSEEAQSAELRARLMSLLSTLTPAERVICLLSTVHGWSDESIAELLGTERTWQSVQQTRSACLRKLAEKLHESE